MRTNKLNQQSHSDDKTRKLIALMMTTKLTERNYPKT